MPANNVCLFPPMQVSCQHLHTRQCWLYEGDPSADGAMTMLYHLYIGGVNSAICDCRIVSVNSSYEDLSNDFKTALRWLTSCSTLWGHVTQACHWLRRWVGLTFVSALLRDTLWELRTISCSHGEWSECLSCSSSRIPSKNVQLDTTQVSAEGVHLVQHETRDKCQGNQHQNPADIPRISLLMRQCVLMVQRLQEWQSEAGQWCQRREENSENPGQSGHLQIHDPKWQLPKNSPPHGTAPDVLWQCAEDAENRPQTEEEGMQVGAPSPNWPWQTKKTQFCNITPESSCRQSRNFGLDTDHGQILVLCIWPWQQDWEHEMVGQRTGAPWDCPEGDVCQKVHVHSVFWSQRTAVLGIFPKWDNQEGSVQTIAAQGEASDPHKEGCGCVEAPWWVPSPYGQCSMPQSWYGAKIPCRNGIGLWCLTRHTARTCHQQTSSCFLIWKGNWEGITLAHWKTCRQPSKGSSSSSHNSSGRRVSKTGFTGVCSALIGMEDTSKERRSTRTHFDVRFGCLVHCSVLTKYPNNNKNIPRQGQRGIDLIACNELWLNTEDRRGEPSQCSLKIVG